MIKILNLFFLNVKQVLSFYSFVLLIKCMFFFALLPTNSSKISDLLNPT